MAEQDNQTKEFALADFKLKPISSAETIKSTNVIDENAEDIRSLNDAPTLAAESKAIGEESDLKGEKNEPATEIEDPIFKELSAPKLPELPKENRARLQMQSPNKIYFYWSFKENPFQTLSRVFGKQTNYQLVAKLVNQTTDREEIFPIDSEGSTWFDVDADSNYLVEIGFYAVNRPFVRVLFSNTLQTPRKNPSPRRDYSEHFAVSANQFAKVLDVSGFQQDAFEVALAGDDIESADKATQTAFSQIIGLTGSDFDSNQSSELRFVLLALASGYSLENLRAHISQSLFALLQNSADQLSAEKALTALQENFGVSTDEIYEEEIFGGTVFGASLINFPRSVKRRTLPKFTPISSLR
ncbi:MAG: DUF4912 domain-containing protein [Pyrinomonadaceae bacterium]|nr:DUF4912 domain-containing protein [Pyrinomonadaceae bacterium]